MHLVECPRDAMQGLSHFIPTAQKTEYLQALLAVGFDSLDFGSFVSPKAIPQLADTAEVLAGLDLSATPTKLLAIIANERGAEAATRHPQITYLGYPLSVSETFQQRNTNRGIAEALEDVARIQERAVRAGQQLVVYLSMGFGNPYGDPYEPAILAGFTEKLVGLGISIVSLADTVGSGDAPTIEAAFRTLIPTFPTVTFGAHLHTTPATWEAKTAAAWSGGCRRFDGAIGGLGGCPMAGDTLTGNLPTENLIAWLDERQISLTLNRAALAEAQAIAAVTFLSSRYSAQVPSGA
ncbi:MAG: hydroxymethylglutaryl-CoA lyase [Hymenobacteraceae bacterium]|nr:hydroxymethylglutaryl-CoA lyase [Hymenobacteraceae bacterium]